MCNYQNQSTHTHRHRDGMGILVNLFIFTNFYFNKILHSSRVKLFISFPFNVDVRNKGLEVHSSSLTCELKEFTLCFFDTNIFSVKKCWQNVIVSVILRRHSMQLCYFFILFIFNILGLKMDIIHSLEGSQVGPLKPPK